MLLSFGDCDTLLLWRITNTACNPSRPLILTPASASGIISHPKQYRRRFKQPKTLCTALATSPTRCSACHSDRRGGFWAAGHAVSIRNLTAPHRRFGPLTRPALGFLPPTTAERLNVWDAQCSSFLLLNEHMLAARGTVSQQQYMSHPFRLSSSRRTTTYGNNLPCLANRTEYKFLALHEAFVRHTFFFFRFDIDG
jgi:hypothetical protein